MKDLCRVTCDLCGNDGLPNEVGNLLKLIIFSGSCDSVKQHISLLTCRELILDKEIGLGPELYYSLDKIELNKED